MLKECQVFYASFTGYSIPLLLIIRTHLRQRNLMSQYAISVKSVEKSSILLIMSANICTHILGTQRLPAVIVVNGFAVLSFGQTTSKNA